MLYALVYQPSPDNVEGAMDRSTARSARLDQLTQELNAVLAPRQEAPPPLAAEVYGELRRLAARFLRQERRQHTLQATALVHEAFLRMSKGAPQVDDRAHFFRLAARTMRNLLINHARKRRALKRKGEHTRLGLSEASLMMPAPSVSVLALHEVLKTLEQKSPRKAQIVELRFFGGCTLEETAEALGVSSATVEREWRFTRAWLANRLEEPEGA